MFIFETFLKNKMGCLKLSYREKNYTGLKVVYSALYENENSCTGAYRYGFNGKENDNEVKGNGNSVDFGARINDPRLGRWFAIDRYYDKYPHISPYSFALNSPLRVIDVGGDSIWVSEESRKVGNKLFITRAIHTTIAIYNTSDDAHDMSKLKSALETKLSEALVMSNAETNNNVIVSYHADVQISVVSSMSEVKPSDHLIVIVDDVTYGDGFLFNTNGVARKFSKIAYVESASLDKMAATAVHEWGHDAGLDHHFDDVPLLEGEKYNPNNYMSYENDRNTFSPEQLKSIYSAARNGKLNQGQNYEKAKSSSNNWLWNTSTNEAPYDFNVKEGEKIPSTIKDK